MAKKRTRVGQETTPRRRRREFENRPFAGLELDTRPALAPAAPEPAAEPDEGADEAEALLAQALAGVTPIAPCRELAPHRAAPRPLLFEQDEDALVMQQLDELVHGDVPFDFADTEEYIEAKVSDLDPRILHKLRRGELALQAHVDLHGLNREEARERVAAFIRKCFGEGKRCVLIVHGRGLGSKDNIPVLKTKLAAWLTRGAIGRRVLAFSSARPHDGGTGAVYVLLRHGELRRRR